MLLVPDKGQLIRCPVEGICITGRSSQGVNRVRHRQGRACILVEHIGEDENGNGAD
jgi:DNA gyrase subunit A